MPAQYLSEFLLKIGGSPASTDLMHDIIEIVVDSSLYLPEMFTILLEDNDLKWVDSSLLELGKEVEISADVGDALAQGNQSKQGELLMKGEITALEPDFSAQGHTRFLIRGYNKAHRLHRGRKTRTFLKKSDSDLASTLAGEAGLTAQVDATSTIHEFVIQNNQTNMEFLQSRADRLGYNVFAANGILYFKKGDATLGSGPTLKLGESLQSFRPILAATHQANQVQVRAWDTQKKEAIQQQVNSTLTQGGYGKTGGAAAQQAFSAATMVVVDQMVESAAEAKDLATGLANDIDRSFIEAEGVCGGDPKVKAGYTVTLQGLGTRFSGKYFVTAAIHTYNASGYSTRFTISGRQPTTITSLLQSSGSGDTAAGRGMMQGLALGLVTNVNSELKHKGYAVKVKYVWLGDNIESDWIRVAAPGAGAERGLLWLPEVNDEVVLGFEHGDIHRPYVLGSLWNSKDAPPLALAETVQGGKVIQRIIKTRIGHQVILSDKPGEEQILIKTKGGHQVVLNETKGGEQILVQDKGNQKILLDTTQKAITIEATQNLTLKCAAKLTIDCAELAVTAKAKAAIKANGQLSLESSGQAELKGTQTAINGSAMVQVQGALVKIN